MSYGPTFGSLFSGVGGLDLGLERAGWRCVWQCEQDEYRRAVLRERFGVSVYEDVREIALGHGRGGVAGDGANSVIDGQRTAGGTGVGPDLICGGFPCQDVSVAGRRAGLAGERSGLFYEFARIAESLRPRWLLIENVPGLLSSNGGRDFGAILGTLADIGYGVAWRIFDSRFFGVPQRRRRVFVLGALADDDPRAAAERAGAVLAVGTRCSGHSATGAEAREGAAVASLSGLGNGGPDDNDGQAGRLVATVADTLRSHPRPGSATPGALIAAPLSHGSNPNSNAAGRRREDDVNLVAHSLTSGGHDASEDGTGRGTPLVASEGVRRLTPTECERLQSFPDGWTDVEWRGKPAADSRRYAALGDAVTVNVAEFIGRRLMEQHLA